MSNTIIPFGAGIAAADTTPEYKDCPRCLERFFGSDAAVWLNRDGVCAGCLSARSLKCPYCNHKVGAWHSPSCATIRSRGHLTEVFVTDCPFPYGMRVQA